MKGKVKYMRAYYASYNNRPYQLSDVDMKPTTIINHPAATHAMVSNLMDRRECDIDLIISNVDLSAPSNGEVFDDFVANLKANKIQKIDKLSNIYRIYVDYSIINVASGSTVDTGVAVKEVKSSSFILPLGVTTDNEFVSRLGISLKSTFTKAYRDSHPFGIMYNGSQSDRYVIQVNRIQIFQLTLDVVTPPVREPARAHVYHDNHMERERFIHSPYGRPRTEPDYHPSMPSMMNNVTVNIKDSDRVCIYDSVQTGFALDPITIDYKPSAININIEFQFLDVLVAISEDIDAVLKENTVVNDTIVIPPTTDSEIKNPEENDTDSDKPDESSEELDGLLKDRVLIWHDEFDGNELNKDDWTVYTGTHSSEPQLYVDDGTTYSVKDSVLTLKCIKEDTAYNGVTYPWKSAWVSTRYKHNMRKGRFEAKVKYNGKGIGDWAAFWLMSDEMEWARNGEVDIMEYFGDGKASASTCHYQVIGDTNIDNGGASHANAGCTDWQIFAVEIDDDNITFFVDGVQVSQWCHTRTSYSGTTGISNIFCDPFAETFHYVIFNLALWDKTLTDDVSETKEYSIDWVRFYAPKEKKEADIISSADVTFGDDNESTVYLSRIEPEKYPNVGYLVKLNKETDSSVCGDIGITKLLTSDSSVISYSGKVKSAGKTTLSVGTTNGFNVSREITVVDDTADPYTYNKTVDWDTVWTGGDTAPDAFEVSSDFTVDSNGITCVSGSSQTIPFTFNSNTELEFVISRAASYRAGGQIVINGHNIGKMYNSSDVKATNMLTVFDENSNPRYISKLTPNVTEKYRYKYDGTTAQIYINEILVYESTNVPSTTKAGYLSVGTGDVISEIRYRELGKENQSVDDSSNDETTNNTESSEADSTTTDSTPVRKAIISIIDDDGTGRAMDNYTGLTTWLNNQDIPMAFALPKSQTKYTSSNIPTLKEAGNEFVLHGLTTSDDFNAGYDNDGEFDSTQFEADLQESKQYGTDLGITTNIMVYPKGMQPTSGIHIDEKLAILQKYFDYGFNVNTAAESSSIEGFENWTTYENGSEAKGQWNIVPFVDMPNGINKSMLINRMEIARDNKHIGTTWWKDMLDKAITNKGYVCFLVHSGVSSFNSTADSDGKTGYDRFKETITYILENHADEVEFLTPTTALEKIKTYE